MRTLIVGALAALSLTAAPAAAQAGNAYAGTWAFQTEDYGNEDYSVIMSGVAVVTPASTPNRYRVQVLAQESIVQNETGDSRLLVARENCHGETANGQLSIECEMAEPLQGYEPDTFLLQTGEADRMVGVMSSATNAQVTFDRMR